MVSSGPGDTVDSTLAQLGLNHNLSRHTNNDCHQALRNCKLSNMQVATPKFPTRGRLRIDCRHFNRHSRQAAPRTEVLLSSRGRFWYYVN